MDRESLIQEIMSANEDPIVSKNLMKILLKTISGLWNDISYHHADAIQLEQELITFLKTTNISSVFTKRSVDESTTFSRLASSFGFGYLAFKSVALEGDMVVISLSETKTVTVPGKETPVKEWVEINGVKTQAFALNKDGSHKMKKGKSSLKEETIVYSFTLPVSFFEDLFKEIGRDSIKTVPTNYVPEDLRSNNILSQIMSRRESGSFWMTKNLSGWGEPPPMPMKPFRIFLQPEKDTDRFEIVLEPYSEEEIQQKSSLRAKRLAWKDFNIGDTETVKSIFNQLLDIVHNKEKQGKESHVG